MSSINNVVPGRIDCSKQFEKGDGRSERFRPVGTCFSSAPWSTMTHEQQQNHTLQSWRPLKEHFLLTCLIPPEPSGLALHLAHLIALLKSFLALFFWPCLLLNVHNAAPNTTPLCNGQLQFPQPRVSPHTQNSFTPNLSFACFLLT